jgi:3-hydroxyacyl-CoA dehydrogenase/enoyl-CoA hydratase/3-hydroxybutyryl-CoA epimerase
VAQADVIIEAIFENLEAKRALFADIEKRARPDALLASNTSSLRIADIASVLADPGRLVGIHFFNPVAVMPLVEVVRKAGHRRRVLRSRAAAFVRRLDKLPLPVQDEPGFLVNAVLGPYMYEALRCMDEGIAPETIDAALTAFGMPMGPIELVDTVGLDIAVAAGKALAGADAVLPRCPGRPGCCRPAWQEDRAGLLCLARTARCSKPAAGAVPAGLAGRIVAPLLAASQACVDRGVVADADLADAGVIFGTGFAPFTGGPLNFVRGQQAAG